MGLKPRTLRSEVNEANCLAAQTLFTAAEKTFSFIIFNLFIWSLTVYAGFQGSNLQVPSKFEANGSLFFGAYFSEKIKFFI